MQGWIKLHRELMNKAIWLESTCEQKVILIALLMMANHQGKEWEWRGERYKAEPGQFVTSLDSIAKNCGSGISIKNVRTALKRFENYDFLANQSTNKNRLITIVNWENYQAYDDEGGKQTGKQRASKRQAGGKQVATNKNEENVKNDKNVKKKEYAEFVSMTEEEYQKLIEQFEEAKTLDYIDKLNLYKGSTGKNYKSDYMTILNWSRKDKKAVKKDERTTKHSEQYNPDELSL